jgi:bifunctional non-homologous end joining protein LigD
VFYLVALNLLSGFWEKIMKKTKSSMPGFIQPQFPVEVEAPPVEKQWLHEIKFDGIRFQVHIENESLILYDVKGEDRSADFPTLMEAIRELPVKSAVLEGEAVILDRQGKSQYPQLQKALRFREDMQVKIFFFDLLFLEGVDLKKRPLIERKEKLESLIPSIHPRLRYSNHVFKDPEAFFDINCKQQLEGIMSKVSTAPYSSGKNPTWTKTKCSKTQEFFIAGFNEVTEEILLGFYEREKLWFAGNVTAAGKFIKIKKKLEKLSQEKTSLEKFTQQKNIHWVQPIMKAEINFSNWTDEKRLRNPVLVELIS